MLKSKLLLMLISLIFTTCIYAFDGITFYGAEITDNDRYNSSGERLTSVRDILRQDRSNYYLFHIRDRYDQGDNYFYSKRNREIFDTARISINPRLANKIVGNGTVLITVFVLTPDQIDVQEGLPTPGVD